MSGNEKKTNPVKLSAIQLNKINNKVFLWLLIFSIVIQLIRFFYNALFPQVSAWSAQQMTMSYKYGFIRRGLLGTLAHLIHDCFHVEFITAVGIVQSLGVILFTVSFLIFLWKLLENNLEKSFCFITLVLISLNIWGFNFYAYGLFETYIIFLTFVMVYLVLSDKALFLIPVLAGICELIHEGYPSMCFGIIAALLIYRFCYSSDKKSRIKYAVVFLLTGIVIGSLFIYFYFIHPRIDNPDIEAILANCRELLKVDYSYPIDISNIRFIWLDDKVDPYSWHGLINMWIDGHPTKWFYALMLAVIVNSVVLSPLIVLTARFWIRIIKNEPNKGRKALLLLCSLMVFLTIPLMFFHVDQARWFCAMVIYEVIVIGAIFLLNANNERAVLSEITKITLPKVILLTFYFVYYWNVELFFISGYLKPIFSRIMDLPLL